MKFDTEKNKLFKLWNQVENNKNIIITQKDNNNFIVDNINELNRKNSVFPILTNFSSDWITPNSLTFIPEGGTEEIVDGSFTEFRLVFNNVDPLFIPYIHCEIVYRVGTSGIIPLVDDPPPLGNKIPFDEKLVLDVFKNRLTTNEIFQINANSVEYISFIRMDFFQENPQEVQYKFFCYILNPHYYQTT